MNLQNVGSYTVNFQMKGALQYQSEQSTGLDPYGAVSSVNQSRLINFEFNLDIQLKSRDETLGQAKTYNPSMLVDYDFSQGLYKDSPLFDITPQRAAELVAEDGYWGINKTADRIASFVLNGAGDDLQKIKDGREGVLKGFKEAGQIWGGTLPDISHATLEKALETIDKKINELGGSVVDVAV